MTGKAKVFVVEVWESSGVNAGLGRYKKVHVKAHSYYTEEGELHFLSVEGDICFTVSENMWRSVGDVDARRGEDAADAPEGPLGFP